MSLFNGNFITFDGDAVTGRAPTQIVVDGPPLTREQYSAVSHAYKLFCDVKNVSLGGYFDQHRTLADGTRVQMISINGVDTVRVVTQPKNPPLALESLFLSVPCNDSSPDTTVAPRYSKFWKFRNQTDVPHKFRASRKTTDASDIKQHPGNLTWWSNGIKANRKPVIVSWYGKATRYGTFDYYGRGTQFGSFGQQTALYGSSSDPISHWYEAYKPAVWTNGVKHKVRQIVAGVPTDVPVLSAGLRKVGDVLYLYVVTHTTGALRVCRGTVDPYKPNAVTVEDVYSIGFTIDPTLTSGTYWQTLMQPLYFNASCNACAGLVSTSDGYARTLVADIDGASTTIDGSLLTATISTVLISESGTYPDFTGSPSDIVASGAHQYSETTVSQRYGAVDYVGDTLNIAIMEFTFQVIYDGSGSYEIHSGGAPGSLFHERSATANCSYRVFLYGTATVLASKTAVPVAIDTFHVANGDTYDTSSGTYSLSVSDPALAFATLEGGDLRNGCVVVCEYVEVGTSSDTATLEANGANSSVSWVPFAYYPHIGFPNADGTYVWLSETISRARQTNLRLAVWKNNVSLDVGPYSLALPSSSAVLSLFSQALTGVGGHTLPFSPLWQGIVPSTVTSAFDPTLPLSAQLDVGKPFANTCAFTPDDLYGFYNVGSGFGPFGVSVTQAYVGAFLFSGTKIAEDQTAFVPGAINLSLSMLASPIFLDNVPTPV